MHLTAPLAFFTSCGIECSARSDVRVLLLPVALPGVSAEQIKKFKLVYANFKLVLDLGAAEGEEEAQRGWPIGPDDFDVMIESRSFTNGADNTAVKTLYRTTSTNQLGGVTKLDFYGMPPPSVEEARRLGGCLNLCVNLEVLSLSNVGMSDESLRALLASLSVPALPKLGLDKLGQLYLQKNKIEDAGMRALASAIAAGAFPTIPMIDVKDNPAGKKAQRAIDAAMRDYWESVRTNKRYN